MSLEESARFVNFPQPDDWCHVVELFLDEKPVVLFGWRGSGHEEMLDQFLGRNGILDHTYLPGQRTPTPALSGDRYRVVGAGLVCMDEEGKRIAVPEGKSDRYGLGINSDFENIFRRSVPAGWTLVPREKFYEDD